MRVKHFTIKDPETWYQPDKQQIFLGDVVDPANSETMSAGFARYNKSESNEFIVTYDEVLIITKDVFTVRSKDGDNTAKAGEIIYLTKNTEVVYHAEEDTELVYVTYPHWFETHRNSQYAYLLDKYHPV